GPRPNCARRRPASQLGVCKLLGMLIMFSRLAWISVLFVGNQIRRMQGRPKPEPQGLRLITRIAMALVFVYGLWLLWYFVST
ncbi:MAG: hypothetical protein L0H29_09230, partial [Sinobacteraceae bacterium]|nr:hypothetical protein [Nevskiaceae bacterium]